MQQKAYSRQEQFLSREKPQLRALPTTEFQIKYYAHLRVAPNNCIYLGRDKHYYSVPYAHIGEEVQVVYTRTLVKVFTGKGVLIATHQRKSGYGYTTVREHLCSAHQHYHDRSPQYYLDSAKRVSAALTTLIECIFEGQQEPEVCYKRCDGLLSLQRKTDPPLFEKACLMAVQYQILTYKFVKNIIENKTAEETTYHTKPLPKHENIRGKGYYQ